MAKKLELKVVDTSDLDDGDWAVMSKADIRAAMSALHPKADMCSAVVDVRFGPQADMCSFNYFISAQEKRLGDGQTERLGGSQIDDEFKLGWLFHRKVSGLRSLKNFVDNVAGAPEQVREVWSIRHQTGRFDVIT